MKPVFFKPPFKLFLFNLLLMLSGCIGTDFLDEPANLVEPRIEIYPEVSAIQIGEQLRYEAVYFDSTDMPVSAGFQWSSSDFNIAAINEAGDVTGVSSGQVRITASAFGISSEQALLTVVDDPAQVAFVEITPMDTSVVVRQVMQFSAATFNAARIPLEGRLVSWHISDEALATIDEQGLVSTLMPGTVQITATSDGVESIPVSLEIFAENRAGTFRAKPGTSYTVKGTAVLEQVSGGSLQLRFNADFQSSNGPDLYVYLSPIDGINAASVNIGSLQSTKGEQVYVVPGNIEMNDFDYVVIHCLPFNVTFGFATLD